MKKKIVRKVSSAKKSISKKTFTKKKKFSLKSWLLGGLALLLIASLGYYYLQPKPLKVLELVGGLEAYIQPEPIDINLIVNGKNIPTSDIPELNAAAAANIVIRDAVKAGKKQDDEEVEQAAQEAAERAAQQTYQQQAERGEIKVGEAAKTYRTEPGKQSQVEQIATQAVQTINDNLIISKNSEGAVVTEFVPRFDGKVDQSGTCQTNVGSSVYNGSTVVGAGDMIYECNNGKWDPTNVKCTYEDLRANKCSIAVTVRPTYALGGGQNCYQGNIIIGQGQIVDTEAGKKQCNTSGQLIAAKQLNGQYLSEEDYNNKFKELMDNCKNNGGSWQQVKPESSDWICGKGNSDTCAKIGKVFSQATQGCVDPSTVNDKSDTKYTTPYSQKGCENAITDKNKEECKRSADNPNLWLIVPKGGTAGNSGVPNKTSSEINAGNTNYNGSIECANALKLKGAGYTCEPIAGGNYYKLTPITELPSTRTYDANATSGFGTSNTQPENNPHENEYDAAGHRYGINSQEDCNPTWEKYVAIGSTKYCDRLSTPNIPNTESVQNNESTTIDDNEEKIIGEPCQNTWIGNTCDQCPEGIFTEVSRVNKKEFMCGNPYDVRQIILANETNLSTDIDNVKPEGENPHASEYGADSKRYVDGPDDCSTEWEEYRAIGSTKTCSPKKFTETNIDGNSTTQLSINEGKLPSTLQSTIAGAGVYGTAGAITGAAICGGIAWGFGAATFGAGWIITPTVVGTCAAWGATLGTSLGGYLGYVSNPPQDQKNATPDVAQDSPNPHAGEYGADNKRYVDDPSECKPQWEEYGSIGSTQYCKPKK